MMARLLDIPRSLAFYAAFYGGSVPIVLSAVVLLLPAVESSNQLAVWGQSPGFELSQREQEVAQWAFDHRQPAGRGTVTLAAAEARYLPLKTARGAEAYELMKMGAISGLSIGYRVRDDSWDRVTGVRTIKKADLHELSLVTMPMNDASRVSAVKTIEELDSLSEFERHLRDVGGFSKSEATALVSRMKSIVGRGDPGDGSGSLAEVLGSLKARAVF